MADRAPTQKAIDAHVDRGDLVLYTDNCGRSFALAPETFGGTSRGAPVLDAGLAYVLLRPRRGLDYDATEDDLGPSRTMPAPGDVFTVQLKRRRRDTRAVPKWLGLRVNDAYRAGSRTVGLAEVEVTASERA